MRLEIYEHSLTTKSRRWNSLPAPGTIYRSLFYFYFSFTSFTSVSYKYLLTSLDWHLCRTGVLSMPNQKDFFSNIYFQTCFQTHVLFLDSIAEVPSEM